ncbi:MAG: PD-(D/E)XK nuclease family protein [Rickettsia sp.]|nr:PD-(D/E)XK nuclease family protein [Rickettsia sp.]
MHNIIISHSKKNFLREIYNLVKKLILEKNFYGEIMFPNGVLCSEFKLQLDPKFLRNIKIVSIDEFFIQSNVINNFEEKLILTKIISSYTKHNYTIFEAMKLSTDIANLFYKIEIENKDIDELNILKNLENKDYWDNLHIFIKHIYLEYKAYLKEKSLISKAQNQILSYQQKIQHLSVKKNNIIIITYINDDFYHRKFLTDVAHLENSYVILPPFPKNLKITEDYSKSLFKISSLLVKLSQNLNFDYLEKNNHSPTPKDFFHNIFFIEQSLTSYNFLPNINIFFAEFLTSLQEYNFISDKILEILKNDKNKNKIAIIIKNMFAKEFLINQLKMRKILYYDLIGVDILNSSVIQFIILLSDIIYNEFSIQKFLNILSHKFLLDEKSAILIDFFSKNPIFKVQNLDDLHHILKNSLEREDILNWSENILFLIKSHIKSHKLNEILKELIITAENIYPNLWEEFKSYNFEETISSITKIESNLNISNSINVKYLIKEFLKGYRIYSKKSNFTANIFIIRPEEAGLINFTHLFLADFHEENYPSTYKNNSWMNLEMQKSLGIDLGYTLLGKEFYNICLNLVNPNIFISFSKKNHLGNKTSQSYFLKKLLYFFPHNCTKLDLETKKEERTISIVSENIAKSKIFPREISITDLELLIKSPYNFYVKKILGLKKTTIYINDDFEPDKYGNLVHQIIHKYSLYRNYNFDSLKIKKENFLNIAQEIVNNSNLGIYSQESYLQRVLALADEFIEFDETRRNSHFNKIYSEIKGKWTLNIKGHSTSLIAIADRIEINPTNQSAIILDFKTGTCPSKKDVKIGMSPQLILEALILLNEGFNIKCKEISSLIYAKLNSYSPYITLQEMHFSKEELEEYKKSILGLLEFYINKGEYSSSMNMSDYDNFSHISRRYEQNF